VAVKPVSTSRAGGTVTTVTGSGFTGANDVTVGDGRRSAVTFNGLAARRFVVLSDRVIVAVTARGSASADPLVITSQHDGRTGNSDGRTRTVNAPIPRVTTVSPATGPTGGSPPPVTLTGQHLRSTSTVRFGSSGAVVQSAASDGTSIVVVPPSRGTPATVAITVTNLDDGDELTTVVPEAYTYELQPAVITGMSASTAVAGTSLTISGHSFVDVAEVRIGTVSVAFAVANDNTIFTTVPATPAGAAGTTVDVVVVNGTGDPSTASPSSANRWTWDASPTITSLSASTGSEGTTITITGANFTGATRVRFGWTDAAQYTVVNANTITARVPSTPAGLGGQTVDLVVQVGTLVSIPATPTADDWTWMAPAVITGMSHHTAPAGTTVTVTGQGFATTRNVLIHEKAVTSYTVVSDTSLTFVVPPADANGAHRVGQLRDVRIFNGSNLVSIGQPSTADDWTFQ